MNQPTQAMRVCQNADWRKHMLHQRMEFLEKKTKQVLTLRGFDQSGFVASNSLGENWCNKSYLQLNCSPSAFDFSTKIVQELHHGPSPTSRHTVEASLSSRSSAETFPSTNKWPKSSADSCDKGDSMALSPYTYNLLGEDFTGPTFEMNMEENKRPLVDKEKRHLQKKLLSTFII